MAPHGWLRYDVERIRSVRHLTDPEHRPGPGFRPRRVWILCEALSGPEAQAFARAPRVSAGAPRLVGRRGDRRRGGVGRVAVFLVVLVLGVPVFGEDPRGEVRVVQVPPESLDGLLVDNVLRSAG